MAQLDDLERLARMRKDGLLTEAEYETEKTRLFCGQQGDAPRKSRTGLLIGAGVAAVAAGGFWLTAMPTSARPGLGVSPGGASANGAMAMPAGPIDPPRSTSTLKGFDLVVSGNLPAAPGKRSDDGSCDHVKQPVTSPGAKLAESRGWIVTSEAKLGRYEAVTIVGELQSATSGMCFATNGNVAIFDGSKLVAIGYSKPKSGAAIASATSLEGGSVRLWSDGAGFALGDLTERAGVFRLGDLAAEERLCKGKAVVPNIFNLPINKARARLIAKGWKPAPPADAPGEGDFAADLVKRGITEAESCSGTGLGYCSYNYNSAAGALNVTTTGDNDYPSVARYEVNCSG